MDALKFLSEMKRMCYSFDRCSECPLYILGCDTSPDCRCEEEDEDIVREVEQWSNGHPRITRAAVFFEQYPTAPKSKDGYPEVDPCVMCEEYKKKRDDGCMGIECLKCREEYWGEVVE